MILYAAVQSFDLQFLSASLNYDISAECSFSEVKTREKRRKGPMLSGMQTRAEKLTRRARTHQLTRGAQFQLLELTFCRDATAVI